MTEQIQAVVGPVAVVWMSGPVPATVVVLSASGELTLLRILTT